mgnify:CR=1 FL=1
MMRRAFRFLRLRHLRHSRHWTLICAAGLLEHLGLDISHVTLANWERGRSEPRASDLVFLSKLYEVRDLRDWFRRTPMTGNATSR